MSYISIKNTNSFSIYLDAASKLGMKIKILDKKKRIAEIVSKDKKILLSNMMLPINSDSAVALARNKCLTKKILQAKRIPVASGICINSKSQLKNSKLPKYPLVVKPSVGGRGKGITTNINSEKQLKNAVNKAFEFHKEVIIEKFVEGDDYRFLVLRGEIIGIVSRSIPFVSGTGKDTLKSLIEKENNKRAALNTKNNVTVLRKFKNYQELEENISEQGFKFYSVISEGKKVYLGKTANWSKGAIVKTYSLSFFHPGIIKSVIKVIKVLDLNFGAVDCLIKNPKNELEKENGVILEVNSYPGINIFHYPFLGQPQIVAPKILKFAALSIIAFFKLGYFFQYL